jgi:uncharacterized protein (DUF433 family)
MNTLATVVFDGPIDDHRRSHARRGQRRLPSAPNDTVNMWLPWRCRNWPSTPAEEHRFVVDLAHRAEPDATDRHTRSDVTAVLNALRGGLTVDQLVDKVPGLPPHRLLAAYRDLEQRRVTAFDAWYAIVNDRTDDALARNAASAGALVPVLIERLCATAELGPEAYRTTVARLASYVEATHRNVSEIETALALWPERAVELGARLYNPYGDALTNRVDHLAQRVGVLTPTRVAALLGEAPTGGCPPGQ